MAWSMVRLAYLWIVHLFVLLTLYRHERAMWVRMNAAALILTPLFIWPLLPLPSPAGTVVEVVGMALVLVPYPLALSARRALGQANWEAPRAEALPDSITASGPYGLVRHPLYVAMFLGATGEFMITGTWFCVPLTLMFAALAYVNAVHDEKKILSSSLGEAYSAYAATVRRRFLPL